MHRASPRRVRPTDPADTRGAFIDRLIRVMRRSRRIGPMNSTGPSGTSTALGLRDRAKESDAITCVTPRTAATSRHLPVAAGVSIDRMAAVRYSMDVLRCVAGNVVLILEPHWQGRRAIVDTGVERLDRK